MTGFFIDKKQVVLRPVFLGLMMLSAPVMTSCAMDHPTYLSQKKVEVVGESYRRDIPTAQLDARTVDAFTKHYVRYGDGPLEVTITYNPADPSNSARIASDNAARISALLAKRGIKDLDLVILPVNEREESVTMVSYKGYTAQIPEGCTDFQSIDDQSMEIYRDYQLGCSTEGYIARQISRPKDLLGRDIEVETDARKTVNNVDAYRWGTDITDDVQAEGTQD